MSTAFRCIRWVPLSLAVILVVGKEAFEAVREPVGFGLAKLSLDFFHSFWRENSGHSFVPAGWSGSKSLRHSAKLQFSILQVESGVGAGFGIEGQVPVCHVGVHTADYLVLEFLEVELRELVRCPFYVLCFGVDSPQILDNPEGRVLLSTHLGQVH
jgi:hypothetical protein